MDPLFSLIEFAVGRAEAAESSALQQEQNRQLGEQSELMRQHYGQEQKSRDEDKEEREFRDTLFSYEKELEGLITLLNQPNYYDGFLKIKTLWDDYGRLEGKLLDPSTYSSLEWKERCHQIGTLKNQALEMINNPPSIDAQEGLITAKQELERAASERVGKQKRDLEFAQLLRELDEIHLAVSNYTRAFNSDEISKDALKSFIILSQQVKQNPSLIPFPLEAEATTVLNFSHGGTAKNQTTELLLNCTACGSNQLEYDQRLSPETPAMEPLHSQNFPASIPIESYAETISCYRDPLGYRVYPKVNCQICGGNFRVPMLGEIGQHICSAYGQLAQEQLLAASQKKRKFLIYGSIGLVLLSLIIVFGLIKSSRAREQLGRELMATEGQFHKLKRTEAELATEVKGLYRERDNLRGQLSDAGRRNADYSQRLDEIEAGSLAIQSELRKVTQVLNAAALVAEKTKKQEDIRAVQQLHQQKSVLENRVRELATQLETAKEGKKQAEVVMSKLQVQLVENEKELEDLAAQKAINELKIIAAQKARAALERRLENSGVR